MAVNTNRNVWGFHGIPAILVGFVVLIGIAIVIDLAIIVTYRNGAIAPYDEKPIRNINNVKMIERWKHKENLHFNLLKQKKNKG